MKRILAATSIYAISFIVFGYGIALGISDYLNLGLGELLSSPFDLSMLIWIPYATIFAKMISGFDGDQAIHAMLYASLWATLIIAVLYALLIAVMRVKGADQKYPKQLKSFLDFLRLPNNGTNENDSGWTHLARCGIYSAISFIVVGAGQYFIKTVFILLTCLPFIFGYIGLLAGQNYVREFVIGPNQCAPLKNRKARLEEIQLAKTQSKRVESDKVLYAVCSRVITHDEKVLVEGRQVISNADSIVLFNPDTGRSSKINLKDQPLFVQNVEAINVN